VAKPPKHPNRVTELLRVEIEASLPRFSAAAIFKTARALFA